MKPDWKDAPEWARYLAVDSDGDWYWYNLQPRTGENRWFFSSPNGLLKLAYLEESHGWRDSLEERPRGHGWKESLEERPK